MRFQAARSSSSATTAESWASPPWLAMARIPAARSTSLPGGQEARQNHPVQRVPCVGVPVYSRRAVAMPAVLQATPLTLQKGWLPAVLCMQQRRPQLLRNHQLTRWRRQAALLKAKTKSQV
jgi:hypothetical protein